MAISFSFQDFFRRATGHDPYAYQTSLATSKTLPPLLDIPTGLGKTAGVIVAWLWRRFVGEGSKGKSPEELRAQTPRRFVYCLPMRVLVEQTAANARQWIENLVEANLIPSEQIPSVYVLMGGEIDRDWDYWPERESIFVGTQDQLISRALNRGYSMSRFRWPVHFGLLNNDALWVMDEVQLMGPGLLTTVQLQGFREKIGAYGRPRSVWMSATLVREDLSTIDSPLAGKDRAEVSLSLEDDLNNPAVRKRLESRKTLQRSEVVLEKKSQKAYAKALASQVKAEHVRSRGGLTLVILNRVNRAQDVMSALNRLFKNKKDSPGISLIHSRFRQHERKRFDALLKRLAEEPSPKHILIATQAIEAGVDISASTLITELAPWASLVQRFGRLNRYGEFKETRALWVDILWKWEEKGKFKSDPKLALPYDGHELDLSREYLLQLSDVGPSSLKPFDVPSTGQIHPVVRYKDVLELFDTTPDLAGNDIDISQYIRDANNVDVSIFWREWEGRIPPSDLPAPAPEELCPVLLNAARDFLQDRTGWLWDGLERQWQRLHMTRLRPGLTLLLHSEAGGYDPRLGWLGKAARDPVEPLELSQATPSEALDDDPVSESAAHVTIATHSDSVVNELEHIVSGLNHNSFPSQELLLAARWHDRGKAHFVFQNSVGKEEETENLVGAKNDLWAKAPSLTVYERPHFRHELASALALLLAGRPHLAAYLVAAHHGKVRLSIRSLPGETMPPQGKRFARGIWDHDVLPAVNLGAGVLAPEVMLTLEFMELGESEEYGPSWLERSLRLLDEYGPFRLGYLESLLRVADWRASSGKEKVNYGP